MQKIPENQFSAQLKGITFFDTADAYGAQANEVLIGKVTTISHGFIRTPLTSLD